MQNKLKILPLLFLVLTLLIAVNSANAFKVRTNDNPIEAKEFISKDLYTSQTNLPLSLIASQIPNTEQWNNFLTKYPEAIIYIDPRSGRPTSIIVPIPFIPGTSSKNYLTIDDISNKLGRKIKEIRDVDVNELILQFLKDNKDLFKIDINEIGPIKSTKVTNDIWYIYIKRVVKGIPVKDSFINISINHGNIVLMGLHKWGDININLTPAISIEEAFSKAFNYIGGKSENDRFINRPHLELISTNPKNWDGSIGSGYNYALAWIFSFKRSNLRNTWEFTLDAHTGEILSFIDTNKYAQKKIVGSIYPVSNDECGVDGTAIESPMPYIDTGFASPNDYTNMGGIYNYVSGNAITHLDGKYTTIADECGTVNESSMTGDIDLGGTSGEHDCTVPPGHSAGDTFAARSGAAELTFINRTAAGWVNYSWLEQKLTANMNIDNTCNAFWDGSTVNFYRSGGGCGNTGEIAAVFDHEWGHGIDYNDANGPSQNPGEVFADVVANLRLHNSCTGRGFLVTLDVGCGQWTCPSNPAITGYNCDGYGDCCLDCTGVRDQDYAKHTSGIPHTPANFICIYCDSGSGPCGMEEHCENAPAAEAVWDLAYRDLQNAPFNYDKNTAFEIAQRLTYIGGGNIVNWYACDCSGETSDGCGSDAGYMNYINADDDDGNLNNGTPHMTAIYDAFNRHGVACSSPTPSNSGCSTGPNTAPTLSGTPSNNSITLNWTAVPNADQYYVYRTESPMGCDFGKILIAKITNTSYTDNEVLNWKDYYYTVQAVGSNTSCYGPHSNCIHIQPIPGPHASYKSDTYIDYCPQGGPGNNDGIIDPGEIISTAITITNDGIGDLSGISGTLSTTTPGINISNAYATFPDIPNGGEETNNPPNYSYQIIDTFNCGDIIPFNLNLTFNEGSNETNFFHRVGELGAPQTIFYEDWETAPPDWTMSGLWHITTEESQDCMAEPYPSSKTVAYYGQDSTCTYATGSTTSGNLDKITAISGITPNAQLTFQFVNENEGSSSYDISYVYVSPDGSTWTQIWTWAATQQTTWAQAGPIALGSWAGQSIYLRFRFDSVDDLFNDYLGWAVDNIQITASLWECNVCLSPFLQPYLNQKPVVMDTYSPTANGIIEPDEHVGLVGTLENIGGANATNVTGTLSTSDPINIPNPNANYPDISSGQHEECTNCYSVIAPSPRPATHWDFTVQEDVHASSFGPWSYSYTYHVGNSFTDVPPSNLFYSFIETILHSNVTSGCTNTQYCPLNNVARQAMAKFICLAMENSSPGSCTISSCTSIFTDVPPSNPFCPFIEELYNLGIVSGCNTNPLMYCPNNYTNRQAMAKFICLAMEAAHPGSCPTASCTNTFGDVPSSNPFCTYIEALYFAGIVNGCSTNPLLYCPANIVNRQQMAKFIVNAFGFTL